MTTIDEEIDTLIDNGNTFLKVEIDFPYYYIYYADANGDTHKETCLVDGEDIVKKTDEII